MRAVILSLFALALLATPSTEAATILTRGMLTATAFGFAKNNAATITVPSGLVGYWASASTINWSSNSWSDTSGSGYSGAVSGLTSANVVAAKVGTALNFNGSSYVNVGNVLNIGTGGFSFGCWFNTTTTATVSLIAKSLRGGANYRYGILLNDGSNAVELLISATGAPVTIGSTTARNDGNWHHIFGTLSAAGAMTLYVDGVSIATGNIALSGAFTSTYAFLLGAYNNATGAPYQLGFVGAANEFRIYNRALSAAEIAQIYAAGNAGHP